MTGTLFVVATPIGNLEDMTARAVRVLREVALIAAEDTRRTAKLLTRYGISTPTTSLHEHNESNKAGSLIERLQHGDHIALVSDAGTPTVSDPGQRLIRSAIDAQIKVEPVPGPSAIVAALSASGFDFDSFTFLGFPPIKANDRAGWLQSLRAAGRVVVFFEAPHRIRPTLEQIESQVGDVDVAVGRELTKAHEEWVRGPISIVLPQLAEPVGEFTVVANVGHVTELPAPARPSPAAIYRELCYMTENGGFTRRRAIGALAKRHALNANEIYKLIEEAKREPP